MLVDGAEVLLEKTNEKQRKRGGGTGASICPYIVVVSRNIGKGLYEIKNDKEKVPILSASKPITVERRVSLTGMHMM